MDGFRSILLPVPEAEDLVDPFRRSGDWSRRHGVPAHLTLAGPFPPATPLPLEALADLAAEIRGSRYELASVGVLGPAVCLFPADGAPLAGWRDRALAIVGGPDRVDGDWRMHLTVSRTQTTPGQAREIEHDLRQALPIVCEAAELVIAELDDAAQVRVRPLHIR